MSISTPPIDYNLDRPGTSGLPTGPEVAIFSAQGASLPRNTAGRICVRGGPRFQGYLNPEGTLDKSCFRDGWFDTGDLGCLDHDGYLFITGRSKEVINRGGELIPPFEVENPIIIAGKDPKSPIYGRVLQVLAFAVPHSVLQEVVGVVLVIPPGERRVDIRHLNNALQSSLQQAKWPALIPYMDGLPKGNIKFLRARLAQRLGLPEMSDRTAYFESHREAACPPPDTDVAVPIPASVCAVDTDLVRRTISRTLPRGITTHVRKDAGQDQLETFLAPLETGQDVPHEGVAGCVMEELEKSLGDYLWPRKIFRIEQPLPVTADGSVDEGALQAAVDRMAARGSSRTRTLAASTAGRVAKIFADVLSCSPSDIDPEAHFFSLGGDSLRAGRLLAALRSEFRVQLPVNLVFGEGSVLALADYIDKHIPATDGESHSNSSAAQLLSGCLESCSSANPVLLVLQLFPLALFYPMRRALVSTLFTYALAFTDTWETTNIFAGSLLMFVTSMAFAWAATEAVVPWLGIAAKWIIIGRYRAGLYPMWGVYHTRWWLTQKIVQVCGPVILPLPSPKRFHERGTR
jgi:acyl carrier protein